MNQYEELLQRLEQIVETMGRVVSKQEENVKRLGEQVDILAGIVWLEKPKKVEKKRLTSSGIRGIMNITNEGGCCHENHLRISSVDVKT